MKASKEWQEKRWVPFSIKHYGNEYGLTVDPKDCYEPDEEGRVGYLRLSAGKKRHALIRVMK